MNDIIVEDKLRELFDTLPLINAPVLNGTQDFKAFFEIGNENDVNEFLKLETNKYPLIWLDSEFEVDELDQGSDADINLILATVTEATGMTNQERIDISFKNVLIPLKENIKKALDRGNTTMIIDRSFTSKKYYNYGTKQAVRAVERHPVGDVWDALKISVSLRFFNNCLKQINYG